MRSAARGSPLAEAEIGVDHPDQRQAREMVALGDELGADEDVDLAALDRRDLGAQPLGAADQVRGQDRQPRVGKQRRHLLGQPLDAGAAGDERVHRAAMPGRRPAGGSRWPQ